MSDHNHSDHGSSGHGHDHGDKLTHGAGHEMDVPPTKELFNIVWGLGALTLLSLVTCVQLFNNQQRDIMDERAKESSYVLDQYRKDMDLLTKGSGEVVFKDTNGVEVKQRYVPLAVARELVISKPERLQAAAPPKGWQHPDDIAAGGQAGGALPPGGNQPAVLQPTGDAAVQPGSAAIVPGAPGQPGVPVQPSDAGAGAAVPNVDAAAGNTPGQPGAAAADPHAKAPDPGKLPAPGAGVAAPTSDPPAPKSGSAGPVGAATPGKAAPVKDEAAGKAGADGGKSHAGKPGEGDKPAP